MYAFERPPHQSFAGLAEGTAPRIRALNDYWRSKCNDVVPPPRSAIEPMEMRSLLPYLLLAELTDDPFRIAYRLVGTAVVRLHGEDFTGRSHDAVASLADSGIEESYRQVLSSKAPVFGRTALYAGDQSWISFDYALFPLSDNGKTVNKCLAIECIAPAQDADAVPPRGRDTHRPLAAPAESGETGAAAQHQRPRIR